MTGINITSNYILFHKVKMLNSTGLFTFLERVKIMENQVYCKAVISKEKSVIFKILKIIMIICLLVCIVSLIPVKEDVTYGGYCDIFGNNVLYQFYNGSYSYDGFYNLVFPDESDVPLPCISFYLLVLSTVIFMIFLFIKKGAKKCRLELNQDGLFGEKKTFFSLQSINQPFEKVDNVYIKNGIIDKLLGGKTIAVQTASSRISLLCIENAEEFLNTTLVELKKYKASVASNKSSVPAGNDSDAMDALPKLKKLLDQGLITKEEFEEKRKELINKM